MSELLYANFKTVSLPAGLGLSGCRLPGGHRRGGPPSGPEDGIRCGSG